MEISIAAPVPDVVNNYTGMWIQSKNAKAFVCAKPFPRVLAFISNSHTADFHVADLPYIGVRTWYMEPIQNKMSGLPARMQGQFTITNSHHVRVVAQPNKKCELQNTLDVMLSPENVLRVTHSIINCSKQPRTINAWSIAAFYNTGTIIVPFGTTAPVFRTITYFPDTRVDEKSLTLGNAACALMPLPIVAGGDMKIGIHSPQGWGAFVRGTSALVMHAPYMPEKTYPEGGGNITMYKTRSKEHAGWCECEHVGPLQEVLPGKAAILRETYRFVTVPEGTPHTPDALVTAIHDQLKK